MTATQDPWFNRMIKETEDLTRPQDVLKHLIANAKTDISEDILKITIKETIQRIKSEKK